MRRRKKSRRNKRKSVGWNKKTRHHIVPKSRTLGKGIVAENIVNKSFREHMAYHHEFSNRTPDEVITFMVEHWFNGQWEWVQIALNKRGAE